jgi:hypothetical protein
MNIMASAAIAADHNPTEQEQQDALQVHFQPHISADEIEQVYHLKRAQPLLQVFTALFHGGFEGVLVRLLVLRELANDRACPRSRAPTSIPAWPTCCRKAWKRC